MQQERANIYTEELKWANKPGFYKGSKHSTGWDSKRSLWLGLGLQSCFFLFDKLLLVEASEAGTSDLICANTRGSGVEGGKKGFSLGLQEH